MYSSSADSSPGVLAFSETTNKQVIKDAKLVITEYRLFKKDHRFDGYPPPLLDLGLLKDDSGVDDTE